VKEEPKPPVEENLTARVDTTSEVDASKVELAFDDSVVEEK
jgi:hypothetical protein